MAINPLLLNVKPISEITTVDNPTNGHLLFYDGSDELKKVDIIEFQSLIGGIAKPLSIADATPTTAGWYKPTTSGTYANAGGLVAQNGYDTLFYFDGTTWSLIATDLPQPIVNNFTNNNTYNLDPEQIVPSEALYTDETLAGDILKRVNKASGVDVNYRKSIEAFNGKDITDVLKDKFPTIFKKVGADFFKIQNDGFFNVKMFGAKGDGTDDSDAFQNAADFCELFSVKTLSIPYGNYYLSKPIVWNRGGVKVQGQGGFGREESWIGYSTATYPDKFPLGTTNTYLGCTVTVPKNSTAFVYSESVVDAVRIEGITFIAESGRTIGNTNAIDFHATFDGPTWNFVIKNCYFRGFNKVVNFQSSTQYCVAFVDFSDNAMSQNDDVLYFSDIEELNVTTSGSRNMSWGLNFENNRCHDNSRLIRGCFRKDLVNIKQNNLEGLIAFADGTFPKYGIDLEVGNCLVNFEGNHSEGLLVQDVFFASSFFRKSNGERHPFPENNQRGGSTFVKLSGNNFDGVSGSNPVVLEGVSIIDYDQNYIKKIHGCTILETFNKKGFELSETGLVEPTMYVFPVSDSGISNLSADSVLSNITSLPDGLYNKNSILCESPLGLRQLNIADSKEGALFNYSNISTILSNKFYGISFLVNVMGEYAFFKNCIFYTNIGNFSIEIFNSDFKKGWNIITCIFPKNERLIDSVYVGIELGGLNEKKIGIDPNISLFTIDDDFVKAEPYFISDIKTFKKKGTFKKGQIFYDELGDLNICTKNGTIAEALTSTTASGNIGDNFFICNDSIKLAVGGFINISGYSYEIKKIIGDKVFIGNPFYQDQGNDAAIIWDEPTFKTVTLV